MFYSIHGNFPCIGAAWILPFLFSVLEERRYSPIEETFSTPPPLSFYFVVGEKSSGIWKVICFIKISHFLAWTRNLTASNQVSYPLNQRSLVRTKFKMKIGNFSGKGLVKTWYILVLVCHFQDQYGEISLLCYKDLGFNILG